MYILIRKSHCPTLKNEIREMINNGSIKTWEFVEEDERQRLIHTGNDQYRDVVLRFINTVKDGIQYTKILPKIKNGTQDEATANSHFGIVLGRFAELLNCHFDSIDSYETVLK